MINKKILTIISLIFLLGTWSLWAQAGASPETGEKQLQNEENVIDKPLSQKKLGEMENGDLSIARKAAHALDVTGLGKYPPRQRRLPRSLP